MKKHARFSQAVPAAGGPAPADGSYHVFESLSTVHHCTCQDEAVGTKNACRGWVKITVETTSEKSELGVYGLNVTVQTSHTR